MTRAPSRLFRTCAFVLVFLLGGAACSETKEAISDFGEEAEQFADEATADIVRPEHESTLPAGDVTVEVEVENFEISSTVDGATAGLVVFYLDVAKHEIPTKPDEPAMVPEEMGESTVVAGTSHTWETVPAGEHEFCVQLVESDRTPLTDPVNECVTVTLTG